MSSSWLLFRTQRRSLLICAALCFLVQFLLVLADIRPSDLDKAAMLQGISLVFALILGCVAGFHTSLFKLPFPVTRRQLAWIPTLCLAALWAAGFAGVITAIGVLSILPGHAYALPQWTPFFLAILRIVPLLFLLFAVLDRAARYLGVGAVGLAGLLPLFIIGDRLEVLEGALALYHYGWPLCIALGVFFILEAPAHIAAMDYPTLMKQGLVNINKRTPGAPIRTPAVKVWADLFTALILISLVIWFVSTLHGFPDLGRTSTFLKVYLAGIGVAAIFGTRSAWQDTQANGFTPGKTLAVFLMKCSLVLLPVAWALGAKRGVVATCGRCRQYKFLWARRCPRCGHASQGAIVRAFPLPPWKKGNGTPSQRRYVSSRILYRVMLPIYLVAFSLINYPGYFRNERFTLLLTQEGLQTHETAFAAIKEHLASVDDPRGWLDGDGNAPLLLPERFRIEVQEYPLELKVQCYWLRWAEAGAVGERLKARILEASPNVPFAVSGNVYKSDYVRARVNRAALPTFLDGGIHWVAQ